MSLLKQRTAEIIQEARELLKRQHPEAPASRIEFWIGVESHRAEAQAARELRVDVISLDFGFPLP